MIVEKNPPADDDEIFTFKEAAFYVKATSTNIYNLLEKGKLKGCNISATDKPSAREVKRIWKSEVAKFLEGG